MGTPAHICKAGIEGACSSRKASDFTAWAISRADADVCASDVYQTAAGMAAQHVEAYL